MIQLGAHMVTSKEYHSHLLNLSDNQTTKYDINICSWKYLLMHSRYGKIDIRSTFVLTGIYK